MDEKRKISEAVIRRLPKYYRYLEEMYNNKIERISSKELSEISGFTASQIRQDFNRFGGFGQQGLGYEVKNLHGEIGKILGKERKYNVIIIGAGNIGQAIANYTEFLKDGYNIVAMFDKNPKLIGLSICNNVVQDIDNLEIFVNDNNIDIAVICTPKVISQNIADRIVKSGIKCIWNFAPLDIKLPDDVIIENVHLNESLFKLTYYYNESVKDEVKTEEKSEEKTEEKSEEKTGEKSETKIAI